MHRPILHASVFGRRRAMDVAANARKLTHEHLGTRLTTYKHRSWHAPNLENNLRSLLNPTPYPAPNQYCQITNGVCKVGWKAENGLVLHSKSRNGLGTHVDMHISMTYTGMLPLTLGPVAPAQWTPDPSSVSHFLLSRLPVHAVPLPVACLVLTPTPQNSSVHGQTLFM